MRDEDYYKLVKGALSYFHYSYNEDIVQDLVLYLFEKFKNYDSSKGEISTYAYAIVKTRYLQLRKNEQKHKCISFDKILNDEGITLLDLICDNKDIESDLYLKNTYEFLKPYITEPLKLWLEGYTQVEIANKLNIRFQTTVSNLINDNLIQLKEICIKNNIEVNYENKK